MNSRIVTTDMLFFLVGGLAGAAIALLLAPQSGKATRDAMRHKMHEIDDSAHELKDRFMRRGEEVGNEAARRVGAAASALAGNETPERKSA